MHKHMLPFFIHAYKYFTRIVRIYVVECVKRQSIRIVCLNITKLVLSSSSSSCVIIMNNIIIIISIAAWRHFLEIFFELILWVLFSTYALMMMRQVAVNNQTNLRSLKLYSNNFITTTQRSSILSLSAASAFLFCICLG